MSDDPRLTKRQLLKYGTATGTALLAGCGGQSDSPETTAPVDTTMSATPTSTATSTPTETPTATETTQTPELEPVAREFVSLLGDREFQAAASMLSPAGESRIKEYGRTVLGGEFSDPAPALQRVWLGLTSQHRGFQEIGELTADPETGAVTGTLACEEADQRVRITVSDDETVSRLEFLSEYSLPAYGSADAYEEQSVTFESDGKTFEGTLAMPANRETAPCVVLVQGANIYNRDSTVGPNKIFVDITRGLTDRGIATYRYDRRRPSEVTGEFTPENLLVGDVVAAVERVARLDAVESSRLFVGGHSLGGLFTPRIAEAYGDLAGMLIFDTFGFGYLEYQLEIAEAVLSLEYTTEQEREQARRRREQAKEIQENGLPDTDRVLGSQRSYIKANLEYDHVATADRIDIPIFVAQAAHQLGLDKRDSFERWRSSVDNPGSQFLFGDSLNHYLQPVEPPSLGGDFGLCHDNVSEQVLTKMANWVSSQ